MMFGDEELVEYMKEHVKHYKNGIRFYPGIKCVLSKNFEAHEQHLRDLEVYEDDVWLLTSPKCGTTWCQEMLWLILNDLDYKGAEEHIFNRSPFLEFSCFLDNDGVFKEALKDTPMSDTMSHTEKLPRPRLIKSHLPLALLPSQLLEKKPKCCRSEAVSPFDVRVQRVSAGHQPNRVYDGRTHIAFSHLAASYWIIIIQIVFVIRDPKDAAVSNYHHHRLRQDTYTGTPEKFFEAFLEGLVMYGSYWHINEPLWKMRIEPNVMCITFEEMKKDLESVVRRSAKFLGKEISEEDMPRLLDHLSFSKMKANNAVNMNFFLERIKEVLPKLLAQKGVALPPAPQQPRGEFIRKGVVGDHKNIMSAEMIEKFNEVHAQMKRELKMEDFPY